MIGVFDSGSGGLTVLSALRARAPQADVVYFGDIKNAPYGLKTQEELTALTNAGMQTLLSFGAMELVSACNSASLSVLEGAAQGARVIEMTRPTARMMRKRAGARILLLATPATIASRIYSDALKMTVQLKELAVPELAGAIERGAEQSEIAAIVRGAFANVSSEHIDGILLACTHYPLVRNVIAEEGKRVWGAVEVIDPAEAVAEDAAKQFSVEGSGATLYRISADSRHFRTRVAELFPYTENAIEVI